MTGETLPFELDVEVTRRLLRICPLGFETALEFANSMDASFAPHYHGYSDELARKPMSYVRRGGEDAREVCA